MAQLWSQGQEFKGHWAWMLALGILTFLLGIFGILASVFVTVLTTSIFGMLLLFAGTVLVLHGIETRQWQGFWVNLAIGLLYGVTGFYLFSNPVAGAMILTLLMASLFFANGLIRSIVALVKRFDHWGWFLASGLVSLLLGAFIWFQWPISGLYIIGLFVGIDLLILGAILMTQAFQVRRLTSRSMRSK